MSEEIKNLDITDELIAERRSASPGKMPDDMPGGAKAPFFCL